MPATTITPYLFFGGRCEEAIAFYRTALGAEVEMLMRFNEHARTPPELVGRPLIVLPPSDMTYWMSNVPAD